MEMIISHIHPSSVYNEKLNILCSDSEKKTIPTTKTLIIASTDNSPIMIFDLKILQRKGAAKRDNIPNPAAPRIRAIIPQSQIPPYVPTPNPIVPKSSQNSFPSKPGFNNPKAALFSS